MVCPKMFCWQAWPINSKTERYLAALTLEKEFICWSTKTFLTVPFGFLLRLTLFEL